jgi:glycosyltransferase involved in cell wall biosynthesis
MKILHIHKFFYFDGGADRYFFDLASLMRQHGHENMFFSTKSPKNYETPYEKYFVKGFSPSTVDSLSLLDKARIFFNGIYSLEAKRKIRLLIKDVRPNIAHVYNIFYHLSPSIFHSLEKAGVPIVMSLLDCQILCASASLYVKGHDCQRCKDSYINILRNNCFRNYIPASIMGYCAKKIHNLLRIWDKVDLFVTASENTKQLFVDWGFDENKIMVNPYFADVDSIAPCYDFQDYCLFVGRLTFEKGVDVLLQAFKDIDTKLIIVGDGPARKWMENFVVKHLMRNIEFVGLIESKGKLYEYIRNSMFTIVPSSWFELFPLIALNSFCVGKPVIGSDSGGIPEIVDHKKNGLIFHRGDTDGLRDAVEHLLNDKNLIIKYGENARRKAELNYTPAKHYSQMIEAYNRVLKSR